MKAEPELQLVEQPLEHLEHTAETALWAAALRLFVEDGLNHWKGKKGDSGNLSDVERPRAFDDLMKCGPTTRYLCRWLDLNPVWISEQFIKQCEVMA